MSSDRSLLERHMADVEPRPFTLDEFHRRRHRKQRNRRIATTVVGVVLAAAAIGGVFQTVASDGDHKAITDDVAGPPIQPASPYVGRWLSTDADGSSQSMEIQPVPGTNDLRMEYHDEAATAMCAGGAATIIGTGQVQTNGTLIIAAEGTCDDGSTPTPMANPDTASEFLRGLANFTLVHDPDTDELTDLNGATWRRLGAALTPEPTLTTAPTSGGPLDVRAFRLEDSLAPGTYFLDPDDDPSTPLTVTFEVAAEGWVGWVGAAKLNGVGHTAVSITTVNNVVRDACEGPARQDPAVGPTVDDLATALSELSPFELTEPPTDVTLLGHQGKHLKITVPDLEVRGSGDSAEYADCVAGNLYTWIDPSGEPFYGYNAEPGRYDEYWILDVDGTRLMISINSSPAAPPEDLEEAQAIIDSIQFET